MQTSPSENTVLNSLYIEYTELYPLLNFMSFKQKSIASKINTPALLLIALIKLRIPNKTS